MTAAHHGRLSGSELRVVSGSATHVGLVREHNEDHLIADGTVFAVADGLGGHAAGEVASTIVIEALAELHERDVQRAEDVGVALAAANQRLLAAQGEHPEQRGMGSTVSGLAAVEAEGQGRWIVFNIGDSRVYRLTGEQLVRVTRDHSEVQELLDAGLIDEEEASRHPLRNVITRSLGSSPAPDADAWDLAPVLGERFVVCSDGLSNELDDSEISSITQTSADPQVAADRLVAAALEAGGRDNISVVVVAVVSEADADEDAAPVLEP